MITRGARLNWRDYLNDRERALIARADQLATSIRTLETELSRTNWKAIADRAIERARSAGDYK